MIDSTSSSTGVASDTREVYRQAFIMHVHCLLQLGYQRLEPHEFIKAEEPAITGKLVTAIKEAMNAPNAPEWVDRYFIADDPPVEDPQRAGRNRLRVDFQFESSFKRPRQTMSFEAKRLGKGHSLSIYLGAEGLGSFLSGEYGAKESDVGMLGYCQAGTPEEWLARLMTDVASSAAALNLCPDSSLQASPLRDGPEHTHRTLHVRPFPLNPLTIYHTFLRFC